MLKSIYNSYIIPAIEFYIKSFSGLSKDIWWLSLMTLINRTGTVLILFLSIYLTEQLHFTKIETGIAIAFFGLGSVAGSYVGGILSDKFGYYKVMFWSLFSVGIMFFILMYIKTFIPFCAVVFLTALIGDSFRPAAQVSFSVYSKKENHTRSLSLYRLAINLGFAIGGFAAGIIAGKYGYHWLFIIDGSTCVFSALFFLWALKEKKEVLSKEEEKQKEIKRSVFQDHWYLMYLGFLLLSAIVFMQIFQTFTLFMREELLFTEKQIGYLFAFNGLLICFLEMPMVYFLVKLKKEMHLITWGVLLIGVAYLVFNWFGYFPWVAVLSMVLISVGEILNFPFSNTLALHRSTINNRGQYMAMFSMLFAISSIIAPPLGMYIVEYYGFATLWNFMGVLTLTSVLGLIYLIKIRTPMTDKMEQKSKVALMKQN